MADAKESFNLSDIVEGASPRIKCKAIAHAALARDNAALPLVIRA